MIEFENFFDMSMDESDKKSIVKAFDSLVFEKESGISGYYYLPYNSKDILSKFKNFVDKHSEIYKTAKNIVVVGVGGSSLGAKAIDTMLKDKYPDTKRVIFLENPDPIYLTKHFSEIKKEETIFVIISKSGGTIETISIFKAIISYYKLDYKSVDSKRVVVVSDDNSILSKFADEYGIASFSVPSNVGGRFSVLSAVGIVPLLLAGYDVKELLDGAKEFMDSFFAKKELHLMQKAYFMVKNYKRYPINVIFSYANCLEDFSKWFVQLWAESLGKIDKEGKNVGLTPVVLIGSVDQHSFLQLIMQGVRDKTVTFMKIDDFGDDLEIPNISLKFLDKSDYVNAYTFNELINAECDATKESIIRQEIPVDSIVMDKLNLFNVGSLIVYFELLTSFAGVLLGINTYNQPGVEQGKMILREKFN